MDRVDRRRPRQRSWCQPLLPPPVTDVFADARAVDAERQHAVRADGRLDLRVLDERWRAAELAGLSHPCEIEDHHRPARLALHAPPRYLPPALVLGQRPQGCDEIELDDLPGVTVDAIRRFGAAERTAQLLRCRVPLRLRAAGRAGVLLESGNGLC